ncbi:hypothetical protein BST34_26740, partial [Mycolicibacterium monacense DSM 44395]
MAGRHRSSGKGQHRRKAEGPRVLPVSGWLSAGAVTVAMGAAMIAGAGLAQADSTSGSDSSSASQPAKGDTGASTDGDQSSRDDGDGKRRFGATISRIDRDDADERPRGHTRRAKDDDGDTKSIRDLKKSLADASRSRAADDSSDARTTGTGSPANEGAASDGDTAPAAPSADAPAANRVLAATAARTPAKPLTRQDPAVVIGNVVGLFVGNGTADRPNAGLLLGNGYSYTATTCPASTVCSGGHGGLLIGNGGNGFRGGNGGNAGFIGNGGAGG